MKCLMPRWSAQLRQTGLQKNLVSWLKETHSLTQRGQRTFHHFSVQPLFEGQVLGMAQSRPLHTVREVVLLADGHPFIFAHSVLGGVPRGVLGRWLRGLGNRSLGTMLFRHPGIQRDELQFARLDVRHALYQVCCKQLAAFHHSIQGPLWARRSKHRYAGQTICVIEVFVGLTEGHHTR